MQSKIHQDVKGELDKRQREFILREQMSAIQKELGDETTPELAELKRRLEEADLPERPRKEADREIERLTQIPTISPEYQVVRTYLEWLADLPWNKSTEDNLDVKRAAADPRRGPLRPREGEAPHPRLPRRAQAEGRRDQGPDPLLRRGRPAPARRRSGSRSPARSGASSSASRSAACATRRRFAAIAARTSARCRGASSRRSGAPAPTTR